MHNSFSAATFLLRQAGYSIFRLGWQHNGPKLTSIDDPPIHSKYEAPNFVATLKPDELAKKMFPRGWRVFE